MKKFRYCLILWLFSLLAITSVYAGSQQISSTTVEEIITDARYYLNEPYAAPVFWTNAELVRWANDGSHDIVARTRCLEDTAEFNLIADQVEYDFPAGDEYFGISSAIYVDSDGNYKGLIMGDPKSVGHCGDIAEPVYWYEWADKIGVYPALSANTTEKVILYFTETPLELDSVTDTLEIPAHYDHMLAIYIAARAFYKQGQYQKGGRLMAEYMEELNRFRADYNERIKEPKEIVK